MTLDLRSRLRGCLLGGAVGDAIGAPIEFSSLDAIRAAYGPGGLTEMLPPFHFTDDTQMTLFTCEGLLRSAMMLEAGGVSHPPTQVHDSYLRWLATQDADLFGDDAIQPAEVPLHAGMLMADVRMHRQEAPGMSCLTALRSGRAGTTGNRINDSKGCGGVMRAAPAGFLTPGVPIGGSAAEAYAAGVEVAALTHGHDFGFEPAGLLAAMVHLIMAGSSIRDAYETSRELTSDALASVIDVAVALGSGQPPSPEEIEGSLGGGWVGEEALAIAIACSIDAPDFSTGVLASINHSGDTDSTGSICGNLLGALLGVEAIPERWLRALDGADLVLEVADDCAAWIIEEPRGDVPDETFSRLFGRYVS